jgi:general secretion pathway protein L
MAQVIVGLDVGAYAVHAARLSVGVRRVELERLVIKRLDDDPWPAVREAAQGADLVFSTLPGDQLTIREIDFPKAAARRLDRSVLSVQLDGKIPFDVDDVVFAHRVAEQAGDLLKLMVVAAPRARVEAHLAELAAAGLHPREVSPGPVVLSELARRAHPEETVAIVDVGHQRTDIAITERGRFRRARTCSFGSGDVTRAMAKAFGVPGATAEEWKSNARYLVSGDLSSLSGEQYQAASAVRAATDLLVREIRQTLAAHTLGGGTPVGRVVLCGAGSKLQGLDEYLASELGVGVSHFQAPAAIVNAAGQDVVTGAKAIALALGGIAPRGDRINLRQGDLAFEGEANAGRGLLVYAVAAVALIMVAWGFSAFARHTALVRARDAQIAELERSSQELIGMPLQNFTVLEEMIAQAAETRDGASPIPERDAFDIVEQISKRIPQTINHEIDVLDIRSGRIQLKGRVDQRRDADEIQKALSTWDECFVEVPVPQTTPAVRDKRLQYTMDIETRCP